MTARLKALTWRSVLAVSAALAVPGTRVRLAQRGKVHAATVAAFPLVPHRYVRAGVTA